MRVVTVQPSGDSSWTCGLVGTRSERYRSVTLSKADLEQLEITSPPLTFDGDPKLLRLGLQAYALGIAYIENSAGSPR